MIKLAIPRTKIFRVKFLKKYPGDWYALRYINPNYKEEHIIIFNKNKVGNSWSGQTKETARKKCKVIGKPIPLCEFRNYFEAYNKMFAFLNFDLKYFV